MLILQFLDDRQQFVVTLPTEERSTWIWMLIFAYFVPEVGTLIRSVRILSFKSWEYPTPWEFFWVMFTEILPAIGSSLFIFVILPEIDVIKAAMLTNAICFVPAVVGKQILFHNDTQGIRQRGSRYSGPEVLKIKQTFCSLLLLL